jgi:hypothetical protein
MLTMNRLAIFMGCVHALGGCGKSIKDGQLELIGCAALMPQIHKVDEDVYKELRKLGMEPVEIQMIPGLGHAYRGEYAGAEVREIWDNGVKIGKELAEKRDAAGIGKYLKNCVNTLKRVLSR